MLHRLRYGQGRLVEATVSYICLVMVRVACAAVEACDTLAVQYVSDLTQVLLDPAVRASYNSFLRLTCVICVSGMWLLIMSTPYPHHNIVEVVFSSTSAPGFVLEEFMLSTSCIKLKQSCFKTCWREYEDDNTRLQ